MDRNYKDPLYQLWRLAVFERDHFKCQFPGCLYKGKKIVAHHIKKWSMYPTLRFIVKNGVCLCRFHHNLIWGKEEDYETLFIRIVNEKI